MAFLLRDRVLAVLFQALLGLLLGKSAGGRGVRLEQRLAVRGRGLDEARGDPRRHGGSAWLYQTLGKNRW